MERRPLRVARRTRDLVRAHGPDAEDFLQRMLSQDVAIAVGEAAEALLLTPKARVVAQLVVLRRGPDDYVLSVESGLGDRVAAELRRARFAAKVEIDAGPAQPLLVFGAKRPPGAAYPVGDYGEPAWEILDADAPLDAETVAESELERLRILAGTPRAGLELDDRVLPAEAGLTERAVSFTKGCYPGQEPVARLHYRGHANRTLRVLALETTDLPAYDAELTYDGRPVGRVTSAVRADGGVVALAYVRREVPDDAVLACGPSVARALPVAR